MAYALGYDPKDFESDEEDVPAAAHMSGDNYGHDGTRRLQIPGRNLAAQKELPSPLEMDNLDTATLEKLGWADPLGFRTLSEVTRLPVPTLRQHLWASKVMPSSELYSDIEYYFSNSHSQIHHVQMRLKGVTTLKRFNENNCDYTDPNVQLLWHGTRAANIPSILTNGFRLPMRNGMFGRGVYFADRVSKSAQYSDGVLFLCAVNLGRIHQSTRGLNHLTAPPPGFDSVQGCGIRVPDPRDYRIHRGARVPCGRTIAGGMGGGLQHNEFIVYDLSKIAILFLIEYN